MTATTKQHITKLADSEAFHQALDQDGRDYLNQLGPGDIAFHLRIATGHTAESLRKIAEKICEVHDTNIPAGPVEVARRLRDLADATDTRSALDWDRINVTYRDRTVVDAWTRRLGARSPLLEPLVDLLRTIRDAKDTSVFYARRAKAMLADAELLLPGVDEALRDLLGRYAGEEE